MSVQCFLSYHAPKEDYNNKPNDCSAFEVFAVDSKALIYIMILGTIGYPNAALGSEGLGTSCILCRLTLRL